MITVEMPDDVRQYENKVWGPFTFRQLICIGIGLLYSVPIALLIPAATQDKVLIWSVLIAPAVACGYVKMHGIYFEQIVLNLLYLFVLTPRKRKQVRKSDFRQQYDSLLKKEEEAKLSKMTAAQKKQYMERYGKNKKIIYSNRKEFKVYK